MLWLGNELPPSFAKVRLLLVAENQVLPLLWRKVLIVSYDFIPDRQQRRTMQAMVDEQLRLQSTKRALKEMDNQRVRKAEDSKKRSKK